MRHFVWDFNPEIFSIGHYGPRYYGLLFAAGFLIGYYIMQNVFRKEGRSEEDLSSLLMYLMIGTIVGARLGHCLFYEPAYYLQHPLEILFIWRGGLASHGGVTGVVFCLWLYCRQHPDQPLAWLGARLVAPMSLAGAFIRMGNFFNSEIIGKASDLPWAIVFKRVDDVARHPSMLYESACYLLLFLILQLRYLKYGKNIKSYTQIGIFFIGIFTARFCIEFTKENQVDFENGMFLNMGQLLSIPFILVGVALVTGLWAKVLPAKEPILAAPVQAGTATPKKPKKKKKK